MRSMTAFARLERKHDFGNITWEVRSVNHRYLDVSLRLPEDLRGLEQAIRDKIAVHCKRGKVDGSLRFKADPLNKAEVVQLDMALAQSVIDAGTELQNLLNNGDTIRAMDVLRWPGVVKEAEKDFSPVETASVELLGETLKELLETREREGAKIVEMLNQRCDTIEQLVAQVRKRRPDVLSNIRTKVETKLADLQVTVDNQRLEQELVMLAQRMDVAEELDRLETHVEEVRNALTSTEPVGRRLDFLMQELNREANTLGSKSADSETTKASVDLKVLIEQMREQVQNVE